MALLLFPLSPLHGFGRCDYDLVSALRTNVSFATGAGKAVAARFGKQGLVPRFSAMGAGYK
jgi:hypothetical protein